jgi:hypothetical protein
MPRSQHARRPGHRDQGLDRDDPPLPGDGGRADPVRGDGGGQLARAPHAAAFALVGHGATLVWVVVQGLFGKYTVTLKLYPAVVTRTCWAAWCCWCCWRCSTSRSARGRWPCRNSAARPGASGGAGAVVVQVALGGWVSTNYAVLACSGFPHLQRAVVAGHGRRQRLHAAARTGPHGRRRNCCRSRRWWPSTGRTGCLPWWPRRACCWRGALWRADAGLRTWAGGAVRAAAAGNWPAACPTWCWTGPSWRRWLHSAGAAALVLVLSLLLARGDGGARWQTAAAQRAPGLRSPNPTMAQTLAAPARSVSRWSQYYALTKPRVVQLIVFCAVIGMLLAEPAARPGAGRARHASASGWWPARRRPSTACRAAHRRRMARTAWRPTAKGELTAHAQTLLFSAVLCAAGSACCGGGSTR